MRVDDSLLTWDEVLTRKKTWKGILLGNGASCAVWDRFGYDSLFQVACSDECASPLERVDQEFFTRFATKNFELVLSALITARIVARALDLGTQRIDDRYQGIKSSLMSAVHAIHVPWSLMEGVNLKAIRRELTSYRRVFTTNYDLLTYWALMDRPQQFVDFFWSSDGRFRLEDTEVFNAREKTQVLYLHGGLHLVRTPDGGTLKRHALEGNNLLAQFGDDEEDETPLFVSEGTTREKLATIRRSDYLSFAYNSFARHNGSLVVFGHGLGATDSHLIDAITKWNPSKIAISMRRSAPEEIVRKKSELHDRLRTRELYFFDAATHPLGRRERSVSD